MILTASAVSKRKEFYPLQIGFLGGDRRMEIAADMLKKHGHTVQTPNTAIPDREFYRSLDLLVLPYPVTRDGVHIALTSVPLASLPLSPKAVIFGGRLPDFLRAYPHFDAEEDEEYVCGNAYLTAAAGVATALRAGERAFFRVRAAVIGYGRIGKQTASMLRALGAAVTVYVRREEAAKEAALCGFSAKLLCENQSIPETLVFGTVPAPADNLGTLSVAEDALIYDLGGGLPATLPTKRGEPIKTLPLRGAPGVFAPLAAGELYGGAILKAIEQMKPASAAPLTQSKKGTDP